MSIKFLAPILTVSPPILPDRVAIPATSGFTPINCGGCGPGEPRFDRIAGAAEAGGNQSAFLPVVPGRAGPPDVAAFRDLLASLPAPTLAFCRSGNRSASLLSRSQSVRA